MCTTLSIKKDSASFYTLCRIPPQPFSLSLTSLKFVLFFCSPRHHDVAQARSMRSNDDGGGSEEGEEVSLMVVVLVLVCHGRQEKTTDLELGFRKDKN